MPKKVTETFSYQAEKARADVLLVHGMTANPSELGFLGEKLLEEGFNVYCPCLSGHARSIEELKKIPASRWLEDVREALEKVLKEANGPVFVAGLSFGALLAIVAVAESTDKVKGLVAMSTPMRFSKWHRTLVLTTLSYLPDFILNLLWCIEKPERDKTDFKLPRYAFSKHSVGAGARIIQIRRLAVKYLKELRVPLLIMQDPEDHHLSSDSAELLRSIYRGKLVEVLWFAGAKHELTLGPRNDEVAEKIVEFFESQL